MRFPCTREIRPGRGDNRRRMKSPHQQRTNASAPWHCANTCMSNVLTKATVLVLNRNWQAINVRTPQEAFCMMATNVATALEIEGEDHIRPVTWEEWIKLPIREQD